MRQLNGGAVLSKGVPADEADNAAYRLQGVGPFTLAVRTFRYQGNKPFQLGDKILLIGRRRLYTYGHPRIFLYLNSTRFYFLPYASNIRMGEISSA